MAILRIVFLSCMLAISSNLFAGSGIAKISPNKSVTYQTLQKAAVSDFPEVEIEEGTYANSTPKTHPVAMLALILGVAGVFLFPMISEVVANKLLEGKISNE
jgi:hypothetical protein